MWFSIQQATISKTARLIYIFIFHLNYVINFFNMQTKLTINRSYFLIGVHIRSLEKYLLEENVKTLIFSN